jgi:hypothetical protein
MPVLKYQNPKTRRWEPWVGPIVVAADAPGAQVSRSNAETIASGTALTFNTVVRDTHGFWNSGSPKRLTVPAGMGGMYRISAESMMTFGAQAYCILDIYKNAVTALAGDTRGPHGSAGAPRSSIDVALIAGDYIEVYVSNDGANGAWGNASEHYKSRLTLTRLAIGQPGPPGVAGYSSTGLLIAFLDAFGMVLGTGRTMTVTRVDCAFMTGSGNNGSNYHTLSLAGFTSVSTPILTIGTTAADAAATNVRKTWTGSQAISGTTYFELVSYSAATGSPGTVGSPRMTIYFTWDS